MLSCFSPLVTILNQNKFIGPNYVDWKGNLNIVLTAEGYKFVMSQPSQEIPALDAKRTSSDRIGRTSPMRWQSVTF